MPFTTADPNINRSGRPKGFAGVAKMIMAATNDGRELVDWALCVWRDPTIEMRHREEAFKWLSDRGLGKPLQQLELGPPGSMEETASRTEHLSVEQLRELVMLKRQMQAIIGGQTNSLPPGNRDQNPTVLDGAPVPLPLPVAHIIDVPTTDSDEE